MCMNKANRKGWGKRFLHEQSKKIYISEAKKNDLLKVKTRFLTPSLITPHPATSLFPPNGSEHAPTKVYYIKLW